MNLISVNEEIVMVPKLVFVLFYYYFLLAGSVSVVSRFTPVSGTDTANPLRTNSLW